MGWYKQHIHKEDYHSISHICVKTNSVKSRKIIPLVESLIMYIVKILDFLGMYMVDLKTKICAGSGTPVILKEKAASAWVDGKNLLGPVVGNFCMDLAIKKAKASGLGMVVAKGSNHFGICGWYTMQASDRGLLGMAFTNTSPLVFPTRSRTATLGTNPLSLAAPGKNGDSFVLDMATTTAAVGKVEMADRKKVDIPLCWGARADGQETTDPKEVLSGGGLLPLGGTEISSGYKGYGLAMLVEIFCGILADGDWGPHIRKWKNTTKVANLGQSFIAIDPEVFAPDFNERMQELIDTMRNLKPVDKSFPVLVAGDPERTHMKLCADLGGIPYHPNQITDLVEIAKSMKIDSPKVVKEL
ncbi:unnamed protein product [Soboliphyme baturini]|uniref:Malate dehydrogenase n=1 Tax=Soboliphyme baturini TaxID=241478 RepID=A0A183IK55_9BILA|nr:unnamed protein product [Soboliphyme baturini]